MLTRFAPSSAGLAFDHLIVQRIPILRGEPRWLGPPGVGHTAGLQIRLLGLGVALLGRGHHGRVDDLPAHRQEAGGTQGRLVGREQHLDGWLARDLGPGERLAIGPDRVGIRHRVGQPKPEEAHEREPVLDQELRALVRERVAGLQDQHLEHEHAVERRPSPLRPIRPGHGTGEVGPEQLEIDDAAQPLQRVALGREILQTLIDVEKTGLTAHRSTSPTADPITPRNASNHEVFGGDQLRPGRPVKHGRIFTAKARDCRRCDLAGLCLSKGRVNKALAISHDYPALLRARRLYQRHRWRSEGFHGEAKTWHGLARAVRRGLANMRIQAFLTAAAVNLKRLAAALLRALFRLLEASALVRREEEPA